MFHVDPEALDAVHGALESLRGAGHVSEDAVARLTGLPDTEVRAALHAVADQRALGPRSSRIATVSDDSVTEFLGQYGMLPFPFI